MFNRQRIFGAHIDVCLACFQCISADDEPFDHAVGIAFEQTAVHERARVALVGVADDVARTNFALAQSLPLRAGREARSTAASQSSPLHAIHNLLTGKVSQHARQSAVPADLYVVADVFRIDLAVVAEQNPLLARIEGDVVFMKHPLTGGGVLI